MNYAISRVTGGRETGRLTRYLVVGGLSTAVDFAVLTLLKSLGLPTVLANSLSYSAGTVVSFSLNRLWTYSDARSKPIPLQFLQFLTISLCGLLFNTGIVLLVTSALNQFFNGPNSSYLPAKIVATFVVFVWNFVANRLWTFNDVE